MRTTLQTTRVVDEIQKAGHITNHDLWQKVQETLPGITLSSIHRITMRLRENGEIGCAPVAAGESVLDCNPEPHSHFVCRGCNKVKDIEISDSVITSLQEQIGSDIVERSVSIIGSCHNCNHV